MSKTLQWKCRSQLQLCISTVLLLRLGGTANVTAEPLKTRGSEYPLCDNQSLTVLLRNRNVCACLSSICGGICFILCSPSVSAGVWRRHVVQMLFLSEHKAGISERRPTCAGALCRGCICHVRTENEIARDVY